MSKPLFIPLRAEYYEAFGDGSKTDELRLYGPRWNERTCHVGRKAVLSRGYGTQNRMAGHVSKFDKRHISELCVKDQSAMLICYGAQAMDAWIAVVSMAGLRIITNEEETK